MLTTPPVSLDEVWSRWLGSITADQIADCNLLLFVKRPSATPEILDQENVDLLAKVDALFYGLLLQGIPYCEAAYRFTGAHVGGAPTIRQYGRLSPHYHTIGSPRVQIDALRCRRAKMAGDGLDAITADPAYDRLKRGLRALLRAMREKYHEERLHEYVRALEALIKPEVRRSTRQFTHRGQTFALACAETEKVLLECYKIRNYVEHLHLSVDALADYPQDQREAIGTQRLRQIETLALASYLKIATSPEHASIFRTDAKIDAFWALRDAERVTRWGTQVDLRTVP